MFRAMSDKKILKSGASDPRRGCANSVPGVAPPMATRGKIKDTKVHRKNAYFSLNFARNNFSSAISSDGSQHEVRTRQGSKYFQKPFSNIFLNLKENKTIFRCLQLNCHKSHIVHDNLVLLLSGGAGPLWIRGSSNNNPDHIKTGTVLLLQEPCCNKDGNPPNLGGFRKFCGRVNEKVRSAIYISDHVNPFLLSQFSDKDHVAVGVEMGSEMVVFASIYMPGDRPGGPVSEKLE